MQTTKIMLPWPFQQTVPRSLNRSVFMGIPSMYATDCNQIFQSDSLCFCKQERVIVNFVYESLLRAINITDISYFQDISLSVLGTTFLSGFLAIHY